MDCPQCLTVENPKPEWICDCGEINCIHVETCPKCLYMRPPIRNVHAEQRCDPTYLQQQLFEYVMFQSIGVSLGMTLQLADMLGLNRDKAAEQLFNQMDKNLKIQAQSILKSVYKEIPISEEDRVLANKTIEKFMDNLKHIAASVKPPPPDAGTFT